MITLLLGILAHSEGTKEISQLFVKNFSLITQGTFKNTFLKDSILFKTILLIGLIMTVFLLYILIYFRSNYLTSILQIIPCKCTMESGELYIYLE